MQANFTAAKHLKDNDGINLDIYCSRFSASSIGTQHIFYDFDSLEDYEKRFLGTILRDQRYLQIANGASDALVGQPFDSLIVRLDADDFFMQTKLKP